MKISLCFTHHRGILGVYDFLLSVKPNRSYIKNGPGSSKLYHCSGWVYYGTPKGNKYEMGGKDTFQYFLWKLNHWIFILYITAGIREPLLCLALKLLSNAQLLFRITFTFKIRDRTYSVYNMELYMERQYLPNILQDWMFVSGAEDLQTICHGPQSSLVFMILNYSHHNPIFCLLTY